MTDAPTGSSTGRPSAAEHVLAADFAARRLLGDVGGGRAAVMLRSWPVLAGRGRAGCRVVGGTAAPQHR